MASDLMWAAAFTAMAACAVAAAELGTRWWLRRRGRYCVLTPGMRLRLSPDRDVFPELEPAVRFDVNREGERGGDVPRRRRGETLYRVLVAGGSQPEGYLLDQDTHWPGALQRALSDPDHLAVLGCSRVHVGNISRSGVGSEALCTILERVLPCYPRLQLIVLLVGASDMLRWLEQGAPPAPPAPVDWRELFRCHPEGPYGWKPATLALTDCARRLRHRWLSPVQTHARAGRWIAAARAMRARARVVRTSVPDPAPMLDHFDRNLRRAVELARARADRVILVRQSWFARDVYSPEETAHFWHGGAGQAWREEVHVYYSLDVTNALMARLDERAARVADDTGVQQVDLPALLRPSLHNYYDFLHLTPAGSRAVAAAVAAAIVRDAVELRRAS